MGMVKTLELPDTRLTNQQEQAAEWLAEGIRKREVCERLGIDASTLWDWTQKPEFGDYAVAVREGLRAECLVQAAALMRAVLEIDTEVVEGRMSPDDPRAVRAARILDSAGAHFAYDAIRIGASDFAPNRGRGARTVNS